MKDKTNRKKPTEITSLTGFMWKISEFKKKQIVYRGQANKKWPVASGAYRRLKNPDTSSGPTSKELLDYNKELIKGVSRYPEQGEEAINDINLLAKIQHHGTATNLIDFTKSALTALWFACEDEKEDGKVFCLDMNDPSKFLEASGYEKEPLDKILELGFINNKNSPISPTKDKKERAKIAKWEPPMTINRIIKQDSFFIFNKTGILDPEEFTKTIIIRWKNKKRILGELQQINNLSKETIFPDLYGFSKNNSANTPYVYVPRDVAGYLQRGIEKARLGKYKEAIEDFDQVIKFDPEHAEAYKNRGRALAALGKYKEAEKDFDKAIELKPKK